MPITESIQFTKYKKQECMNNTPYQSCFIPYNQTQFNCTLNPLNNNLQSTQCNIFSSIEKLTNEDNLNLNNSRNLNSDSMKKSNEENEPSTKMPYLFPMGWVPPPPHILLAYLQAAKLFRQQQQEQQQQQCLQEFEHQSKCLSHYQYCSNQAAYFKPDKVNFIKTKNWEQKQGSELVQNIDGIPAATVTTNRRTGYDRYFPTEQHMITIQQEIIQLKEENKTMLTITDLKNNAQIYGIAVVQIKKQIRTGLYQVICSKSIPSGVLLGPFRVNGSIYRSEDDDKEFTNKSSKLLSISDSQSTTVNSPTLNSFENANTLWMTLVRDVTSLNSQTHQDTSVHSQLTIKPNITIISLYDDDNSQLKLYNFDNAYLKNFHSINSLNNELNTNRIIYFQTQRCINAGEEFLLSERNPLGDMHLLLSHKNENWLNSTGNLSSINLPNKAHAERNNSHLNPYFNYPNVSQNGYNGYVNKIYTNNSSIKNYTVSDLHQSLQASKVFSQNDFTLQQLRPEQQTKSYVKTKHFDTSLSSSSDKSWDNILKLSENEYQKHNNNSCNETSAFSHVSLSMDSNNPSVVSTTPTSLMDFATDSSNASESFKRTENIVKSQLKAAHELETSPAHEGYTCDRCGKMFAYQYYRDKHLKYTRCMDQGDRKYPCKLCSRSFEKRDRLRIHVLHVHEKHRPHKCHLCGKNFSQSSSLNKHLRVHSGERPYKCCYCNKAFTASSILRTHIRQHSGEKPFKCKFCWKPFASHAAHDSHVRRTHAVETKISSVNQASQVDKFYESRITSNSIKSNIEFGHTME
uniref:C2H2-type domain-containing protein n=1 Tax=Trichobilharzia regenti TaxID=157069 RepID=A0AA85KJ68_TRIRE|nr:unnamed protein product [Trichobilharzia regenti]